MRKAFIFLILILTVFTSVILASCGESDEESYHNLVIDENPVPYSENVKEQIFSCYKTVLEAIVARTESKSFSVPSSLNEANESEISGINAAARVLFDCEISERAALTLCDYIKEKAEVVSDMFAQKDDEYVFEANSKNMTVIRDMYSQITSVVNSKTLARIVIESGVFFIDSVTINKYNALASEQNRLSDFAKSQLLDSDELLLSVEKYNEARAKFTAEDKLNKLRYKPKTETTDKTYSKYPSLVKGISEGSISEEDAENVASAAVDKYNALIEKEKSVDAELKRILSALGFTENNSNEAESYIKKCIRAEEKIEQLKKIRNFLTKKDLSPQYLSMLSDIAMTGAEWANFDDAKDDGSADEGKETEEIIFSSKTTLLIKNIRTFLPTIKKIFNQFQKDDLLDAFNFFYDNSNEIVALAGNEMYNYIFSVAKAKFDDCGKSDFQTTSLFIYDYLQSLVQTANADDIKTIADGFNRTKKSVGMRRVCDYIYVNKGGKYYVIVFSEPQIGTFDTLVSKFGEEYIVKNATAVFPSEEETESYLKSADKKKNYWQKAHTEYYDGEGNSITQNEYENIYFKALSKTVSLSYSFLGSAESDKFASVRAICSSLNAALSDLICLYEPQPTVPDYNEFLSSLNDLAEAEVARETEQIISRSNAIITLIKKFFIRQIPAIDYQEVIK